VDLVVRWIGVSCRRRAGSAQKLFAEPASVLLQAPAGNVVIMTWAQTYGWPTRRAL